MYKTVQRSSRRTYGHNVREGSRRHRTLARERVRLTQLAVCAALFAVVFIGKGVFPQRLTQLQEDLQALLSSDTDFRAALADLGENLAGKGPVLGELGTSASRCSALPRRRNFWTRRYRFRRPRTF